MADASTDPRIAVVTRFYDALNRPDIPAAIAVLRQDFVDHSAPPGTPPGVAAMESWVVSVRDAFPDLQIEGEQWVVNGDMVGVVARSHGTHKGAFFGIEPTGRTVDIMGMMLWRIDGDRIAERWGVLEYDAAIEALEAGA